METPILDGFYNLLLNVLLYKIAEYTCIFVTNEHTLASLQHIY